MRREPRWWRYCSFILIHGTTSVFPVPDLNELDRKDTMLLKLLPDKLQSRLKGCLIDIDELEIDTQLGKGTHGVISANGDVLRIFFPAETVNLILVFKQVMLVSRETIYFS